MDAEVLDHKVTQLAPQNIAALWSQIAPIIRPAVEQVSTHTVTDIYRAVMSMRAQLWVELRGTDVISAVVTEFIDYPAGLFVRCWLCGARSDTPMDGEMFLNHLDEWRQNSGAIGFEAIGRHGWMKRFPDAKIEGLIMRWVP